MDRKENCYDICNIYALVDPFTEPTDEPFRIAAFVDVHYAPYGRWNHWWGKHDCGAAFDEACTGIPDQVTCKRCKRLSPGLWPNEGKDEEQAG